MTACIFCKIVQGDAPATVVYEDEIALGFFPLAEGRLADGHVLVISKRHVRDAFDATEADLHGVMVAVKRVATGLRAALEASGVNILNASGPNSDQSVNHLHFHIVPRWAGDAINTWPKGRSEHRVEGDSATRLREHFASDSSTDMSIVLTRDIRTR